MDADRLPQPIMVPELGMADSPVTLSVWLVPAGAIVAVGDRVVEILAGEAVLDLPAPAAGVLIRKEVREDEPVRPGQVLGWIHPEER